VPRLAIPKSERYTPYFAATAPLGLKSASSVTLSFSSRLNAACTYLLSTEMPTTSASAPANFSASPVRACSSFVQMPLNESG
jgi:hypothetical protein